MKRLTLLRHAKSSWKNTEMADFDRPLNTRGEGDAPEMGQRLAERQFKPDCIIASPARRAITTAYLVADEIGFAREKIILNEHIYDAAVSDLVGVIQQIDESCNDVMLVGHNPGFTELSTYLTNTPIENIPTTGVFCIELAVQTWADVAQGSGVMVFFDYPKNSSDT
jgi:phosphohistidine phosphatase